MNKPILDLGHQVFCIVYLDIRGYHSESVPTNQWPSYNCLESGKFWRLTYQTKKLQDMVVNVCVYIYAIHIYSVVQNRMTFNQPGATGMIQAVGNNLSGIMAVKAGLRSLSFTRIQSKKTFWIPLVIKRGKSGNREISGFIRN